MIAEINPRISSQLNLDTEVSFVPMSAVSEISASVVAEEFRVASECLKGFTPFQRNDVLVAKITPCFENGKIVIGNIHHEFGFGSTEFHVVRPKADQLDPRYLLHYLRQPHFRLQGERRMTGSAGQRRVPAKFLSTFHIPLPTLKEQRRIAAILDAADNLRVKRRAALSELDTLLRSLFLDMFGDPEKMEWPIKTIADVALQKQGSIRTGPFGSQLLHSEFVAEGIRVLGIDNVVANEFRAGEARFITPEKYRQLKRYTVQPGDVLITIMGTCGRCAVVPDNIGTAINTKHLCCITLDPEKCIPAFLHAYFLLHSMARIHLERSAKGAIMAGLNMAIIKKLPIPIPPLDLQHRFAAIAQSVEQQKTRMRAHLAELDTLFASLQSRAFNGEL